ncbi:MAG: peptidylprolyl isomerase [Candidatus Omnitrophica bacterium]|nr:peptidylprolyl isomerase [Candidatus Omnitrophota bacterium]
MSHQVISFHYTLTDQNGKQLDSSRGNHPLTFLSGAGQIIPGLEKVLLDMKAGDKKVVTVLHPEAYGIFNQSLVYKVTRSQLPAQEIKIGDVFATGEGETYQEVMVVELTDEFAILDGNHPLAGKDLTFDVEITTFRPATPEEIAHGHVHGEGGHHH